MVAALVPVLPALLRGESFYFRDLARYYLPLRQFMVEGLRQGELRYWNPLVFEGLAEVFPPLSYPLDLLQVLLGTETGFTLLLALHLPLAALGFFVFARVLQIPPEAAAGGAVVYAAGGFALSTLSLYDTPALAWSMLAAAALLKAASGYRAVVVAALATAILLSTGRVEMAAQGLLLAVVLARPGGNARPWRRLLGGAALGALLAAPTLLVMQASLSASRRGQGLETALVTARSIHPLGLLQVVIGNLHGDLANLVGRFWGDNFFEPGIFPYYASLYLGPIVVGLAVLGASSDVPWRRPLLILAAVALWFSVGKWSGLGLLVDAVPSWARLFRFPAKAFFTVHVSVCLLAAAGLAGLITDARRWRRASSLLAALGVLLVATLVLPRLPEHALRSLVDLLFPARYPAEARMALLEVVTGDAARGGALALLTAGVALAAARGRLLPAAALVLIAGLAVVDLLRTGAGLNPSVTQGFFSPSPEMESELARLREEGGRVFTCGVPTSAAWKAARPVQSDALDVWTFAAMRDTATPYFSLRARLPAAFGDDLTALVPVPRTSAALGGGACASVPRILDKLRRAGVAHVVSLDPLDVRGLRLRAEVRPRAVEPLVVHVYDLLDPLPLRFVARDVVPAEAGARRTPVALERAVVVEGVPAAAGVRGQVLEHAETTQEIRLRVEADGPTVAVVRDAWAPGWRARVNGRETPVLRADGRHRAVPVPAGRSEVVLEYRPPGLRMGLALAVLAASVLGVIWRRRDSPQA